MFVHAYDHYNFLKLAKEVFAALYRWEHVIKEVKLFSQSTKIVLSDSHIPNFFFSVYLMPTLKLFFKLITFIDNISIMLLST